MGITVTQRNVRVGIGSPVVRPIVVNSATAEAIRVGNAGREIIVKDPETQIIDAGKQGLPGRDGQDAGSIVRIANQPLGGHRMVHTVLGDLVDYADNTDPTQGDDLLGMTLNAANADAEVTIARSGRVIFNGWTWTPLEPVFLGTNGLATQTAPTPEDGAAFLQVIGYAEAADSLFLDIQTPIYF